MPKNIEDILPPNANPERRSIRDIPIPEGRKKNINIIGNPGVTVSAPRPAPTPVENPGPAYPPYKDFVSPKKSGSYSKRIKWLAGAVLIVVVVFGAFSFFPGATLSYAPKTTSLAFSSDVYSAVKSADPGSGKLLFSVIQLTGDKGLSVSASGSENVTRKSSGTIVVYNNFSQNSQTLVKNTRFQTTDGKIYRISSDLTIPGQKTVSGSLVPGSIEAVVTADQPGADYNIGLSDFTVPGLKDDPRFTTVYARSKTSMSGGLVGVDKKVNAADLVQAKTTLESQLKADLIAKARAQVPADFILFADLSSLSYDMLPNGSSTDTTTTVNERGNFSGVMFKKSDLAAYLYAQKQKTPASSSLTISDSSKLTAAFASNSGNDLLGADTINFQLDGQATLAWVTDVASLALDLVSKSKSELATILAKYPSIASASATFRPFWKSSFPNDPTKIKIEEIND